MPPTVCLLFYVVSHIQMAYTSPLLMLSCGNHNEKNTAICTVWCMLLVLQPCMSTHPLTHQTWNGGHAKEERQVSQEQTKKVHEIRRGIQSKGLQIFFDVLQTSKLNKCWKGERGRKNRKWRSQCEKAVKTKERKMEVGGMYIQHKCYNTLARVKGQSSTLRQPSCLQLRGPIEGHGLTLSAVCQAGEPDVWSIRRLAASITNTNPYSTSVPVRHTTLAPLFIPPFIPPSFHTLPCQLVNQKKRLRHTLRGLLSISGALSFCLL